MPDTHTVGVPVEVERAAAALGDPRTRAAMGRMASRAQASRPGTSGPAQAIAEARAEARAAGTTDAGTDVLELEADNAERPNRPAARARERFEGGRDRGVVASHRADVLASDETRVGSNGADTRHRVFRRREAIAHRVDATRAASAGRISEVAATDNACERDLGPAAVRRESTHGCRATRTVPGGADLRTVVETGAGVFGITPQTVGA
jgi:hypothetical protein